MIAKNFSNYLHLGCQGYTQLPKLIFEHPELETLDLSNNRLTVLDERLGALVNLRYLDLSFNAIDQLPASFGKLQQLEVLVLSRNVFSQFPEIITSLPKLRHLSIEGNQLPSLSDSIGQLQHLESLDVSVNQLTKLPSSLAKLQQLRRFLATSNQLATFPVVLCALPKLQWLKLKSNGLTTLPENIRALRQLEVLDVSFNPLISLPDGLAELRALRHLLLTANAFTTFPEVLLGVPSLERLEDLDLEFKLGLRTEQLVLLFNLLKRLPKSHRALKKALFCLLFDKPLEGIESTTVWPLLALSNRKLQRRLINYLTKKSPTPNSRSSLWLLGQPHLLKADERAGSPWVKEAIQASHIVIGKKITKKQLQELPTIPIFLSERQVQQHYFPPKELAWLEENKASIVALLHSYQTENIFLALQWLEGSTMVQQLATDLLLAYIHLSSTEKEALKAIQASLQHALPDFEPRQLPHATFKLYTPGKSETELSKRIAYCSSFSPHWDGLILARYLYQKHQAGYRYLLEHLDAAALRTWLQPFLKQETLCLSPLLELKKLPPFQNSWTVVCRLDLRGCSFMQLPPSDLLKQMPNLEEIDLRDNPIRHLPRRSWSDLSSYRILISK